MNRLSKFNVEDINKQFKINDGNDAVIVKRFYEEMNYVKLFEPEKQLTYKRLNKFTKIKSV
jgi:hypothetical protein